MTIWTPDATAFNRCLPHHDYGPHRAGDPGSGQPQINQIQVNLDYLRKAPKIAQRPSSFKKDAGRLVADVPDVTLTFLIEKKLTSLRVPGSGYSATCRT